MSGWGKVTEGGQWSPILRKVRIPIVSDDECVSNVGFISYIIPYDR